MNTLRAALLFAWVVLVAITAHAIVALGNDAAMIIVDDFSHAWRAQYYSDFIIHVLLLAGWVFWRERSKALGLALALCCIAGGALFTLAYLFVTTFRVQGDGRRLLLGHHA
jgi:hypothetical protein